MRNSTSPTTTPADAWSRVPDAVRAPVHKLAEIVQSISARHFVGLTLYGPVLEHGFDARRTPVESVWCVDEIDLRALQRLSEHAAQFGRGGQAVPIVLTPAHIEASRDTFPLELLEIARLHATIAGRDCFADLSFDAEHIRLQCERELKRVMIQMRQGLLASEGRERMLADLQREIGRNLLRTLVGVVWLQGERSYQEPETVITHCEALLNCSLSGIRSAAHWDGPHGWEEFAALYHDVEKLASHANEI